MGRVHEHGVSVLPSYELICNNKNLYFNFWRNWMNNLDFDRKTVYIIISYYFYMVPYLGSES